MGKLQKDPRMLTGFPRYLFNKNLLVDSEMNASEWIPVVIDHHKTSIKDYFSNPSKGNPILIRMEPQVVMPSNYLSRGSSVNRSTISVGRLVPDVHSLIRWPITWPKDQTWKNPVSNRLNRAIIVSANKFSFVKGELYSLRREAIAGLDNLDVAGRLWMDSKWSTILRILQVLIVSLRTPGELSLGSLGKWDLKPESYVGSPDSKINLMRKYRIALVVENDSSYMSEKLFDALLAGCIPVYVGPHPEQFGIWEGLVVNAEPNLESIREGIEIALKLDETVWRQKVHDFLTSNETLTNWSEEHVYEKLLGEIYRMHNLNRG
jgi:hypothetical protein